jgi:hypothetical protein
MEAAIGLAGITGAVAGSMIAALALGWVCLEGVFHVMEHIPPLAPALGATVATDPNKLQ